jgi:hypothetical protein
LGSVVCGPRTKHKPLLIPHDFGLRDSRRRLFGLGVSANGKKIFNISRPSPSCGLSVRYSRSSVIFNRGLLRYAQGCEPRLRSLFALLQSGQALRRSYGPLWRIGIPEWRETYQPQSGGEFSFLEFSSPHMHDIPRKSSSSA